MCYLCYCFRFESLSLSSTQCTRNMLMYMKALCTARIINYGVGEDCQVEALRGAQGNQAVWISTQITELISMRHYKESCEEYNFVEAVESSPPAGLSEHQTHSYLTTGRGCRQRTLEAEIGLDQEVIEMGDKVC